MTEHAFRIALPEGGFATLTLPPQTGAAAVPALERALRDLVGLLRRDLAPPAAHDPGALEVASWMALLRQPHAA